MKKDYDPYELMQEYWFGKKKIPCVICKGPAWDTGDRICMDCLEKAMTDSKLRNKINTIWRLGKL